MHTISLTSQQTLTALALQGRADQGEEVNLICPIIKTQGYEAMNLSTFLSNPFPEQLLC